MPPAPPPLPAAAQDSIPGGWLALSRVGISPTEYAELARRTAVLHQTSLVRLTLRETAESGDPRRGYRGGGPKSKIWWAAS